VGREKISTNVIWGHLGKRKKEENMKEKRSKDNRKSVN
jgi:hypothetical protein